MASANGRNSVFITGAASGIGAATAKLFAERGWFVGLFDVDADGLAQRADEIGAEDCVSSRLDVRSREDWAAAIQQFGAATGGRMDVLFNNAGVGRHGWFEDIAPEDSDWIVDVNVKGVINGVYAALPLLRAAAPNARIVNVASTAGFVGSPQLAVYSATKFAVRGLTEALDVEMEPIGVKVVSLAPWFVETPILDMGQDETANRKMRDDLAASSAEIYPVSMAAEQAWTAAHGKDLHYGVGKRSNQARFMARFLPKTLRKRVAKGLPKRA